VSGVADTFTVVNQQTGKCLAVNGSSTADGATVIQSTCNGGLNQQFTSRKVTYSGNDTHDYQLLARHSGKCVDVSTISTAARAPIHQWTCNPPNQSNPLNQTWRLSPRSCLAGTPGQLRDFQVLQENGRTARLTIGPWPHEAFPAIGGLSTREALDFALPLTRDEQPAERASVRLFVMGQEAWRDFEAWPPPGYEPRRFHLQSGGALSTQEPGESDQDRYRYDPAEPTPAVGGVRLAPGVKPGRVDNTELEARPDVLTY
jgi:hypothetical protein